jgi:chorismate lyase/3-hydroxybenzoate synthase
VRSDEQCSIVERQCGGLRLRSIVIEGARDLDASTLEGSVRYAYRELLARFPDAHLARVWNLVADIHGVLPTGQDRYMHFNAGRRAGYEDHACAGGCYPAATGVGHAGSAIALHAFFTPWPVATLENPRQVPAWRYSRRYGEVAPSFARASAVERNARRLLLVAGTASVSGEDTAHPGDLEAQITETLENLRSVLNGHANGNDALGALTSLRVYVPNADDTPTIRQRLRDVGALRDAEIEFVLAPLCRRGLLVEIEGSTAGPEDWET